MFAFTFTSALWKLWGGSIVLVSLASMIVIRAIQTIASRFSVDATIPYIIVTFLVIVSFVLFGRGFSQLVGGIVFGVLTGLAALYWLVAMVIDALRKLR